MTKIEAISNPLTERNFGVMTIMRGTIFPKRFSTKMKNGLNLWYKSKSAASFASECAVSKTNISLITKNKSKTIAPANIVPNENSSGVFTVFSFVKNRSRT